MTKKQKDKPNLNSIKIKQKCFCFSFKSKRSYDKVRLQIVSMAKLMFKLTAKLMMFFRLKSMYKGLNKE